MITSEIKAMQTKLKEKGFYHGEIDGQFGRLSIAATQSYLRSLMPKVNPWPKDNVAALTAFYGKPGDESQLVSFDFPYPTFYAGKRVQRSRCHRKVKDSLVRILTRIGDRWGNTRGVMEEAEDYGGIYNFREMRGGSGSISRHSWGIAIDLDADDNGLWTTWPQKADMPLEIMEEFAREGWLPAGAFWLRDAMHFQATS